MDRSMHILFCISSHLKHEVQNAAKTSLFEFLSLSTILCEFSSPFKIFQFCVEGESSSPSENEGGRPQTAVVED
jgi:hypothetical protein